MKRLFRKNIKPVVNVRAADENLIHELTDYSPEETEKKIVSAILCGLLFGLILSFLCFLFSPTIRDYAYWLLPETHTIFIDLKADKNRFMQEIGTVEKRVAALRKKWSALIPKEPYLIVDTSGNQIFVKKGKNLLHQGVCSTGSYVLLRASRNRHWIFRTPRGQFRVLSKMRYPVWYMPDWAFIEEGRPVPPHDSPKRFEEGVLGEYALAIGNGYLIHGTLYKRMLGMPVTHGCVRLGDDDLDVVAKNLTAGSMVYIY